jgi:hypothetical protein
MNIFVEILTNFAESQIKYSKFLREQEAAPDVPATQGEIEMQSEETTEKQVTVIDGDGYDDSEVDSRLIQGEILRCVDGRWSLKDDTALPPNMRLVAVATAEALQHWQDQKPIETIVKQPGQPLPNVDELNAAIPEKQWEEGLDGSPRPPWVKQQVVYLINPADASIYTYINSTTGAQIAVRHLKDRVRMMRALRGSKVVPIVELNSKVMKTRFGQKARPEFVVHDWRELSGLQAPSAVPAIEHVGKPVAPVTVKDELNDDIPF